MKNEIFKLVKINEKYILYVHDSHGKIHKFTSKSELELREIIKIKQPEIKLLNLDNHLINH